MKRRTKIILASILGTLLVGPFLIPVNTSGTQTKEEAADAVWSSQSQWTKLLDHEVHFVSAGDPNDQTLIVLLHGFGASALSFKPVINELSQHGYVIAYDRAAFGFTERPTNWEGTNPYSTEGQLAVLDELVTKFGEGKQLVLIGHSAGGQLAALYAIKHTDKLSGLVLEDPAILTAGGAPDWLNWIFYIPQLDHLGPLLVSSIATSGLGILDQSYFDKSKITQETIANYTQPLRVKGWEQAFWEFNRAPRLGVERGELANLQVPTLVITGDADEIVPTKDSIEVAGLIPGAELTQIPNTGHLPHEESSDDFLKAVVRFLEVAEEG